MKKDKKVKRGIYKHYKGNLYEVLDVGKHSETEEWMVIYRTLYGDKGTWVRPYDMFFETVDVGGKILKRFEYMGKS
ncbi:MAG: Unknown protein [uncultured Sulfurovum sp.]|uniref:DUF1653 domain-containing protein n=1 Tax=uncultured Sulfurovum sp. TaxID=269237 RepID=A0A6S6TIK1_9BACT|nr:MAG: Unknown protein [uncultured Sulfurovum sp.]